MNLRMVRPIVVALLLGASACLVDASWLGLVGRWQDAEVPSMELEFTRGGGFTEYFYGEVVGYGEFRADGSAITLHYLSPCGSGNQLSCDVRFRFTVTEEALIITDAEGDIVYRRVSASQ